MEVLVTGGGGFIGKAVVFELEQRGDKAVVFDRKHGLDVTSPSDLQEFAGVGHVIHLAGVLGTHELFDTVDLAIDVNIKGTVNVLEFCKDTGAGYTGITMPAVFPSIYTATKIAAVAFATAYHFTHGVPVSHVRAFNAFGPGQSHGEGHPQKIIPTFAHNIWRGLPVPIWGDGEQKVDLIYTDDLADVLAHATLYGNNETFDGGTGTSFTVNKVADMVGECVASLGGVSQFTKKYLPMRRGEVPTDIVARGENWDKLALFPHFDMEDLCKAVEFYRP